MINTFWQFLLVVSNIYQSDLGILTVIINDILYHLTVDIIKTMKGLIENKKVGFFYEGSCQ